MRYFFTDMPRKMRVFDSVTTPLSAATCDVRSVLAAIAGLGARLDARRESTRDASTVAAAGPQTLREINLAAAKLWRKP